ncbi:threonine/serine exporter family protein [Anaerotignum sp. MB30-C6]|uniref:threonine/serine exporter family protein n=1 Tax=Anaerotignum sp. MB30-C6 TaxID=3070814 RepID=UPI0027DDE606|nr:threonine/serine exporter family protein [Anaerotignum sp. MB30-C6]WMI81232.1 threonine/serine exporter family protein [Anaerotignum sp. MB30-C6]
MMDDNQLLKFALDAGEVMLSSGAETHRVQDTMHRILSVSHSTGVEAMAMSTFLIVSIPSKKSGSLTLTRGVYSRSVNFEKICSVNDISRSFVSGQITLGQAARRLEEISHTSAYSPISRVVSFGVACGGFAMVLDGTWIDGLAAFAFGLLIGVLLNLSGKTKMPYFFSCMIGGFIAGAGSVAFHKVVPAAGTGIIIIGSIMPLLPGMTMTNSIRDIMEGNFISGTSKMVEALLIAFAIAGGVGFGITTFGY